MTSVLTKSKLESTPHNNIFAFINNRSYVKDPKSPNSTTEDRTFVYEVDPFAKSINFKGMPYIILFMPTIEYSKVSTNGKVKEIKWIHIITVRALKDGNSNANVGVGREDMLSIGDDLNALFNTETRKQELRDINIFKTELIKTSFDSIAIQEQDLYEAQYELTYMERFTVSS